MCGIAGYATIQPGKSAPETLERMTNAIRHRGPDDSGFYRSEHAALGHRRLSIVDLALGHQPLGNETGDIWVVFNGEIFNHAELRPALEHAGHRYATHSDTETIVHAYEEYGPASVERLRGMFSFAIWDDKRQNLVLRTRPARKEAVLLLLGRPAIRVRFRNQGAASSIPRSRHAFTRAAARIPGVRLHKRRSDVIFGISAS